MNQGKSVGPGDGLLRAGLRAKLWCPSYLLEWCGAVTMCICEKVLSSGFKVTVKFQSHSPVEQKCVVTLDHEAGMSVAS